MAEVTRISRLSVPIPIQRVVEEEESEEEVKKTSKEEVAEDVSFVGRSWTWSVLAMRSCMGLPCLSQAMAT